MKNYFMKNQFKKYSLLLRVFEKYIPTLIRLSYLEY
jgi:hypothetical protein